MTEWKDLLSNPQITNGNDNTDADKIIYSLWSTKDCFFKRKSNREKTKIVKVALVNLGHELGYKVYGNGLKDEIGKSICKEFVNREWVFDIHWYKDKPHYLTTELRLAVECEWGNKREGDKSGERYSAIKFDFEKLLITNALLKLLIFKVSNLTDEHFKKLDLYFDDAIKTYHPHQENKESEFLFVCFQQNSKGQKFVYAKKPVKPKLNNTAANKGV